MKKEIREKILDIIRFEHVENYKIIEKNTDAFSTLSMLYRATHEGDLNAIKFQSEIFDEKIGCSIAPKILGIILSINNQDNDQIGEKL